MPSAPANGAPVKRTRSLGLNRCLLRTQGFDQPVSHLGRRGKDKTLAETAALLVLSKKARGDLPQGRGRMIGLEDGRHMAQMIDMPHRDSARLCQACKLAGVDVRTPQRWKAQDGLTKGDRRPEAQRPLPAHALPTQERAAVL